jgi:hypothetical protein
MCDTDVSYTPLSLHDRLPQRNENIGTAQRRITLSKSKTLPRRHVRDLETPDVDKIASKEWQKASEIFPETAGFMISIQDKIISAINCKKYILKDPNTTEDSYLQKIPT